MGACILSGLALLLFLFCLAYSFLKKGEAGPAVAALALLSVNFSAFSLRLALPVERGEFLEKRWLYGAVGLSVLLLFIWLFFLFLGLSFFSFGLSLFLFGQCSNNDDHHTSIDYNIRITTQN